jgi:fatty acid-binding protein DegV
MLICHANCPESVEYVKGLLKERFGVTDVRDEFIGPVIGAHTGCGTLGLFFVGTGR